MLDTFDATNTINEDGIPTGGTVDGVGLKIKWQEGALGRGTDRKLPNGAFIETVIAAAKQRLEFFQTASDAKFFCPENAEAIDHLTAALKILDDRTKAREARAVEGTHTA